MNNSGKSNKDNQKIFREDSIFLIACAVLSGILICYLYLRNKKAANIKELLPADMAVNLVKCENIRTSEQFNLRNINNTDLDTRRYLTSIQNLTPGSVSTIGDATIIVDHCESLKKPIISSAKIKNGVVDVNFGKESQKLSILASRDLKLNSNSVLDGFPTFEFELKEGDLVDIWCNNGNINYIKLTSAKNDIVLTWTNPIDFLDSSYIIGDGKLIIGGKTEFNNFNLSILSDNRLTVNSSFNDIESSIEIMPYSGFKISSNTLESETQILVLNNKFFKIKAKDAKNAFEIQSDPRKIPTVIKSSQDNMNSTIFISKDKSIEIETVKDSTCSKIQNNIIGGGMRLCCPLNKPDVDLESISAEDVTAITGNSKFIMKTASNCEDSLIYSAGKISESGAEAVIRKNGTLDFKACSDGSNATYQYLSDGTLMMSSGKDALQLNANIKNFRTMKFDIGGDDLTLSMTKPTEGLPITLKVLGRNINMIKKLKN